MAQTSGTMPGLYDNLKKRPMPPMPKKPEPVPGMMATRQALKGHRAASVAHIPKKGR